MVKNMNTDEDIKEEIIEALVDEMYTEQNGVKDFLEKIFKGEGNLNRLLELIKDFDKGQKELNEIKKQFYKLIDDLKISGKNKYHRDTISQILEEQRQRLKENKFQQKYSRLLDTLKQYNQQIKIQNSKLEIILPYMLLFQQRITELLNIRTSFLLTTQTEAKIKTYNKKNGQNIASILKISSDQKVKIIDQALQDMQAIIP